MINVLASYKNSEALDFIELIIVPITKERYFLCRQNVTIYPVEVKHSSYGKKDAEVKHSRGSIGDAVTAGLLYSLCLSGPEIIEHLQRLILFQGEQNWTLKLYSMPSVQMSDIVHSPHPGSSSSNVTALIRHYRAKTEARAQEATICTYDLCDCGTITFRL